MATRQFIPLRILLSINLIFSTAVVLLSGAAALRIPVRKVSIPVSAILLGLAAWVIFRSWRKKPRKSCLVLFLVGLITVSCAIWPAIQKKVFVSAFPDTWAYVAFGQYLNDYIRGTEGGLSAIDQFGAALSNSRFGTATLLAYISDLMDRTTAEVLTPWAWLVLWNVFAGIASFCYVSRLSAIPVFGASVFFILCGWLPTAVFVGNLDNALFLSILPFTLVRYRLFAVGKKSFGTIAVLAITIAACFYSFPEGVAIAGIIFLPWLAGQLPRDLSNKRNWKFYGLLLMAFLLLIEPYANTFIHFLQVQFTAIGRAAQHPYPGEGYFPGLMTSHLITGIFALGGEAFWGHYPGVFENVFGLIIATVLIFLLLSGVIRWRRRNRSLIMSLLVVSCLASWQGFLNHYDYGLYKILLIGSVVWIPCVFTGIEAISGSLPRFSKYIVSIGLSGLICISGVAIRNVNVLNDPHQGVRVSVYSGLKHLQKVVDDKPIALICHEDFDQQWAAFFLRNANLTIQRYTTYMAAQMPFMVHARASREPPKYVLTDYYAKRALWKNSRLRLLRTDMRPEIVGIDAPNIVEGKDQNFIWLGNEPTRFYVTSDRDQTGCFTAKAVPGPSRPEDNLRSVTVRSDKETQSLPVTSSFSCIIRLHTGLNEVDFWCNEQRTILKLGPSDTRTMLVGLQDFSITVCGSATR
jgi:uncharacterized membrane protein (UPF0136 family)